MVLSDLKIIGIKTISWRIIGSTSTLIIGIFLTDNFSLSLSIASLQLIVNMILYFLHECVWNRYKDR
jgi:uncharacterized membrane protein